MTRLASWLLFGIVLAGAAFTAATSGALPPRVATHFGAGGAANGWMPRTGYTWTMLVVQTVLPLLLFGARRQLPKRAEHYVNLPNRDDWLASGRRETTVATLRGYGAAMGIVTALLLIAVHAAILDANAKAPPRLDEPMFVGGLVAFVVAMLAISVSMFRRFRRVPGRH